ELRRTPPREAAVHGNRCSVNERTLYLLHASARRASPARPPERLPGDDPASASACSAESAGAAGGSDGGDKKERG
uniref:Uncharacterized protein n=1 Tax=Oryza meridionalis TaxID=40149 RepID=A0A0E0E4W6_9ORYZ